MSEHISDRIKLTAKQARDLRNMRIAADLSQYDLAELTGLTRPKIKRIEKREITTVAPGDIDKMLGVLSGKKRASGNGDARRRRTSTSGRPKVSVEAPPPDLDEEMRAEVRRRLEESVLDVMRDIIGDAGRVLVEKHKLHDVTLGRLFQVG